MKQTEMGMKLWLLRRPETSDYDIYYSAIVAAKTSKDAQTISPDRNTEWDNNGQCFNVYSNRRTKCNYPAWVRPSLVTVKYIGEAKEGTESGVILASFNAG